MSKVQEIEYRDQSVTLKAFVAYPEQGNRRHPCVLVAHDWGGRGEAACAKAKQLADLGYVGFALDMYGDARLGHTDDERRALLYPLLGARKDVERRMVAAYMVARGLEQVDPTRIAAIGYCFGGLCVLDLARSGADVKGVVSFHGLLTRPQPPRPIQITSKVLVLHGYDDPLVPPEQLDIFAAEMTENSVDWQLHIYGLTKHSFTNPLASNEATGLVYDAKADRRSWESTMMFLREVFKESSGQ